MKPNSFLYTKKKKNRAIKRSDGSLVRFADKMNGFFFNACSEGSSHRDT